MICKRHFLRDIYAILLFHYRFSAVGDGHAAVNHALRHGDAGDDRRILFRHGNMHCQLRVLVVLERYLYLYGSPVTSPCRPGAVGQDTIHDIRRKWLGKDALFILHAQNLIVRLLPACRKTALQVYFPVCLRPCTPGSDDVLYRRSRRRRFMDSKSLCDTAAVAANPLYDDSGSSTLIRSCRQLIGIGVASVGYSIVRAFLKQHRTSCYAAVFRKIGYRKRLWLFCRTVVDVVIPALRREGDGGSVGVQSVCDCQDYLRRQFCAILLVSDDQTLFPRLLCGKGGYVCGVAVRLRQFSDAPVISIIHHGQVVRGNRLATCISCLCFPCRNAGCRFRNLISCEHDAMIQSLRQCRNHLLIIVAIPFVTRRFLRKPDLRIRRYMIRGENHFHLFASAQNFAILVIRHGNQIKTA